MAATATSTTSACLKPAQQTAWLAPWCVHASCQSCDGCNRWHPVRAVCQSHTISMLGCRRRAAHETSGICSAGRRFLLHRLPSAVPDGRCTHPGRVAQVQRLRQMAKPASQFSSRPGCGQLVLLHAPRSSAVVLQEYNSRQPTFPGASQHTAQCGRLSSLSLFGAPQGPDGRC